MDLSALKQLIRAHEGVRQRAYKDTKGNRTVGVGFNLDAANAEEVFQAALPSVNYANIRSGVVALTTEQVETLFTLTLSLAIDDATDLVPSFDAQPEQVQMVLVDMIYNLGKGGLSHFVKFLAAVEREDYKAAVAQLTNSAWYHQVHRRAQDDIALLNTAASYRSFEPEVSGAPKQAPSSTIH